ncbi:MAG: hypothetical protein A2928_04405 [Candidatus Taylorbacteria bacterium RIFCSPLOWO2_01_FULL_45_15b]|uniref:SpoVT-AbrB domain-containing protein n=1 Tax=Candidatus Taylorbacteria bacterium RIFCSPLOWO2_01_FULL_45_15b TaxID=1802319 RepID=A0A1G2N881_9BACT|nr:MAG: hypothetical protein A2928_04405 [Candidatus Taylorbacteria bacterium RIFCSPLOWO2_01_FULL_45_15b]
MIQKVLKVGSSAAVTIPKKSLEELGLKVGDQVKVSVDSDKKRVTIGPIVSEKKDEMYDWTKKFIKKYRKALEELADK